MTADPVARVLIVDDEQDMRELLTDLMEMNGLEAMAVEDGAAMREALQEGGYSLLILDLRLRREDGLTLARNVRQNSRIPIIILTGKGDETDRILGLELAADDYLMKPFNPRELLARVRALLRRAGDYSSPAPKVEEAPAANAVRFGGWTFDMSSRTLFDADQAPCTLTPSEYSLLENLVRNANRVQTRNQLLEHMRGEHADVFDRTIDVLILRLRRKIERNPSQPRFIRTERGMGYIFRTVAERS